jgi:serine/threonine-protein kinase
VEAAIGLLETLAAENPSSPLVHAALGRAYLYQFNLTHESRWVALARESCSKAGRLDADMAEVHLTLGHLKARTGQPADAITEFERALAQQPNSTEALRGLAYAYERAGRLPEAERNYKRAVSLQPAYWAGYNDLGAFYYIRGNYPRALEMFRRVVEFAPDNAYAYSNLGGTYEQTGQFEKALAAYEKSIALRPTSAAYSNLGTLSYFLGRFEAAVEASEKAVRLTPGNPALWANLGDARRFTPGLRGKSRDAYAQAIGLGEGALRGDPGNVSAQRALVRSYAKTGRIALARRYLGQALALDPQNPESLYQAAVVANLAGEREEALRFLKRAVERGFGRALIARDPELANLRGEKGFREAVQGAEAPGTETR